MLEKSLEERQQELRRLCEQHPIEIPVIEAAKYLGISPEGLRYAIIQGTCGFSAIAWRKPSAKNYAYYIPTLTFYNAFKG